MKNIEKISYGVQISTVLLLLLFLVVVIQMRG